MGHYLFSFFCLLIGVVAYQMLNGKPYDNAMMFIVCCFLSLISMLWLIIKRRESSGRLSTLVNWSFAFGHLILIASLGLELSELKKWQDQMDRSVEESRIESLRQE